jgi:hypothetical protein
MYEAFFDGGATMEAMFNEGGGTETQRATQVHAQTSAVDIEEEPNRRSKRTRGYTELGDVRREA